MTKSKGYIGIGMNGLIAALYDKDARKYSMGLYREWARRLALQIHDGDDVLEIAPGPAYLAIELAKLKKSRIVTLEISRKFVAIARKNIHRRRELQLTSAGEMLPPCRSRMQRSILLYARPRSRISANPSMLCWRYTGF